MFHYRNIVSHFLVRLHPRSALIYRADNEKAIYQIYLSQRFVFYVFV